MTMNQPRGAFVRRTFVVMLGFGICLLVLGEIVPKFKEVYESVDVPLPSMTSHLLRWSEDFLRFPPLFILMALVASVFIAAKGRTACGIAWAGFALFGGFAVVALFLPTMGTLQGIGAR